MTDIVVRLRELDGTYDITTILDRVIEAADEIERLHKNIAKLESDYSRLDKAYDALNMRDADGFGGNKHG